MIEKTGVPTRKDLAGIFPPKERLEKGPVAVIECFQRIPCDPCYTACRRGAIEEFEDINDLPRIDFERCNGCSVCVSKCPGLAIFIVDETYSEKEALIKLPFEFLPLPQKGEEVDALNRQGEVVGEAKVVKVQNGRYEDKTPVISILVPKKLSMEVRNIRLRRTSDE
ncbi:MAG: 4Fe-4S binding protein [Candidatus Aerophobetes bacterium]|nr:4Fe-4S binding protein [Candidatus Aerophobetes bacterium]